LIEVFAATEFNKTFSDKQSRQGVKFLQLFRDGVRSWNFGEISHLVATVCPRKCYWIYIYFF